jgi:hypothetical protein
MPTVDTLDINIWTNHGIVILWYHSNIPKDLWLPDCVGERCLAVMSDYAAVEMEQDEEKEFRPDIW